MDARPSISLIVPTRNRPDSLRRLLTSLAATAVDPDTLEVILVVDDDDSASFSITHQRLRIRHLVGPPGRTMGTLNADGWEASGGDLVMLLNDDVVARTRGWDRILRRCFGDFPDGIALIHVNDTLIREHLCVFPVVSRRYCELAGGICPRDYVRYRIDDHIEDVFNMLAYLGERRTVYLPDVVFEHFNAVEHPEAGRVYQSDPAILAVDAPHFEALFPERKELVLRLVALLKGEQCVPEARRRLEEISDPFALRTAGRQRVVRTVSWGRQRLQEVRDSAVASGRRLRSCIRQRGYRGLIEAIGRRLMLRAGAQSR